MATLESVITLARKTAYDRFPMPVLYLKGREKLKYSFDGFTFEITLDGNVISSFSHLNYPTMQDFFEGMVADPSLYGLALPASFVGNEPLGVMQQASNRPLEDIVTLFRPYVVSEVTIADFLLRYFAYYRRVEAADMPDFETAVAALPTPTDHHLALWLAYQLVEQRREYLAMEELSIIWTNDVPTFCSVNTTGAGFLRRGDLSMQIGDVFSYSDSPMPSPLSDAEKVGAINFWGDDGVWYRLQLKIRSIFEKLFGDYSLQPNQVANSTLLVMKDTTDLSWFDSFPYESNPNGTIIFPRF